MLTSIRKRLVFMIQVSFFLSLVGFSVVLASSQQANAELTDVQKNPTTTTPVVQPIQAAPWYGSVSSGAYITDPTPSHYEKLLDTKFSIVAWFVHWDEKNNNEKLAYACSHGYVPQITWESRKKDELTKTEFSLDRIIAGEYDQFIKSELESIKKICREQTVIIRFNHEMDTLPGQVNWYPWQGYSEKYIAAWKRVVGIGHDVSPTIKWLWSPNRGVKITKTYYPGDEWVDYVGITINRNPKQFRYTTFDVFYGHNQQVIESFNKPIMISESTYDQEGGDAASKAIWIASMAAYIKSNPKIVSFAWFQARMGQSIESSPESIAALKSAYAVLESR